MKPTTWLFAAGMAVMLSSCGENSTTDNDDNKDTLNATSTTTTYSSTVNVPAPTKTNFETKYPSASNVRWNRYTTEAKPIEWDMTGWPSLDTNDYVVMFDWDGYNYYAWYDDQGNWIGSTYAERDHSKLPSAVNKVINSQYKGYTIVEVDKEIDKDRSAYEVELEKGEAKVKLLIAENGSILKKVEKDAAGNKTKEKIED